MEQDLTVIRNFHAAPEKSLELLGKRLGLRLSRAELVFCARRYKDAEITPRALRLIDALACPERITLDKIAIGELLTDDDDIAATYADAVSKLNALGKPPEKPFTLQDIADLSVRYTAAAFKKSVNDPIGFGNTAVAYAADGMGVRLALQSDSGHFDVLAPLPFTPAPSAEQTDAIVLLCPAADMTAQDFGRAVTTLLCSELGGKIRCFSDTSRESPAHAVLRTSAGAVFNLARLPEHLQDPLALATCHNAVLLILSQDTLPALTTAAQELGLCAYYSGIADQAGRLVIQYNKDVLMSLDTAYLRSICFVRSYSLRVDKEQPAAAVPLFLCGFESTSDQSSTAKRTRHAARTAKTGFASTALCALQAYLSAVAAGGNPEQIELSASIVQAKHKKMSASAAMLLSGLLGLHRAGAELRAPVQIHTDLRDRDNGTTVLASAPLDATVPASLQGGKVYLLAPHTSEHGMPVWSEVRALSAYLSRAIKDGSVKSARVLCNTTPRMALNVQENGSIAFNPYAEQVLSKNIVLGIIAESDGELAGELIALYTPPTPTQNDNIS